MASYAFMRRFVRSARRIKRIEKVLLDLDRKVDLIMPTLDDIKAGEAAEGESIAKLVALTDAIFEKLSGAPSDDPRVQEVLDMIAANKRQVDDAVTRDTPAA